jgi:PmbA protein
MQDAVNLVAATDHEAELRQLVGEILARAQHAGADAAEVSASEAAGLSVTVRMGELETVEFNRDRGFGITVYIGNRKGSASTSDTTPGAIEATVLAACNIARYSEPDPCHGLADAALMARHLPALDLDHPWSPSVAGAEALALEAEAAARGYDRRVTNSDGASVATQRGCSVYGNTHGFLGSHIGTRHSISCGVIAADANGKQRDHHYSIARRVDDLEDAAAIGREAARRACARLGARRVATGRYSVLFGAEVAASLVGHVIAALSGGALYRKASFLTDSLGRQLLPSGYSIVERPLLPGGVGSAAFDGDGVATYPKAFVDDGMVASYVLGSYSARRLGLTTTGNAGGVHNIAIEGPERPIAEMLAGVQCGLLVTEFMGQGVNLVTGDYSRGVAGFWIEAGEIAFPVEELTVAGNLAEIYRGIVGMGDDPDRRGNVVAPTLAIDAMTIAAG